MRLQINYTNIGRVIPLVNGPHCFTNISLDQLEMVKDYLKNHLNKGLITYNDVLYASPILFTKKL